MTDLSSATHPAYAQWLAQLKTRFRQVQIKAAVAVNTELLQFYWALGADIAAQQAQVPWGSGFLAQLSQDLMREFPQVKGFSLRNLKYIRKCPDPAQALFYVQQTQLHSWSRAVLTHQIEGGLFPDVDLAGLDGGGRSRGIGHDAPFDAIDLHHAAAGQTIRRLAARPLPADAAPGSEQSIPPGRRRVRDPVRRPDPAVRPGASAALG